MSEQEHAPGPWLTVKSKPNRVRDESGVIIAQVSMPPTKLDKAAWMKGKEISHANARLIAAAPDMLDALEQFVEEYVEMINSGDCGFWDPEKEDKVIKARAALSKALTP